MIDVHDREMKKGRKKKAARSYMYKQQSKAIQHT